MPDNRHKSGKHKGYKKELHLLQVALVRFQRELIASGAKVLVLFEGRDAAGKDGAIKRIVEHLSPRETRVVALGKPSDRDNLSWYFQRYVHYLPAAGEMVLMNRSWYNRAGVEHVMGFCTDDEYEDFMRSVPTFERMIMDSGIQLFKYYLDISRDEQKKRLKERSKDPLTQWKISPIDKVALKHWQDYSEARNAMLERTHSPQSPWVIVRADDKKRARLNVIRHLLSKSGLNGKHKKPPRPDPRILFNYDPKFLRNKAIAP
jgi:polyphosphate kinase 2